MYNVLTHLVYRYSKSPKNDMLINLAISAVFVSLLEEYDVLRIKLLPSQSYMNYLSVFFFFFLQSAWIAIQRSVEYKPLQFMSFVFVYRIFEKLKSFEGPSTPTYNVSFFFFKYCLMLIHLVTLIVLISIDVDTGNRRKGKKMDED